MNKTRPLLRVRLSAGLCSMTMDTMRAAISYAKIAGLQNMSINLKASDSGLQELDMNKSRNVFRCITRSSPARR
jgi:hypothetical protein